MPTNEDIIEQIKELALQLDGEVTQSTFLNMKEEWRRMTIDYDRHDREKS
tara:strand:+ start:627 stop:776 length:150 start_codon:yes stop_codon:yes gene_type:complete